MEERKAGMKKVLKEAKKRNRMLDERGRGMMQYETAF
jgi:hypothetical protein